MIKRIKLKRGKTPFYLVSLIEHKSDVDYNVVMQIFRYMAFIWEDYEKEQNRERKGISRTKDFKYPPILPIVYYEGKDNWTAATRLHDRVFLSDMLGEYIPDYRCIMMQLNKYTNRKLMEKEDELSVIMMINKLQRAAEFTEQVKERKMGELFANFEAYDVQATRAEARAEERKKNIEEAIEKLIQVIKELGSSRDVAKQQLIKKYSLTEEEAVGKVELYW